MPNLETAADGFFTGGTLVVPAVTSTSTFELETFTLFGETFTFIDAPSEPNDILAQVGDTADVIAARVRSAIDSLFGAGTVLPLSPLAAGADQCSEYPRVRWVYSRFRDGHQ